MRDYEYGTQVSLPYDPSGPSREIKLVCELCDLRSTLFIPFGCYLDLNKLASGLCEGVFVQKEINGSIGDPLVSKVVCPECGCSQFLSVEVDGKVDKLKTNA